MIPVCPIISENGRFYEATSGGDCRVQGSIFEAI
jgi:hypothetical protein